MASTGMGCLQEGEEGRRRRRETGAKQIPPPPNNSIGRAMAGLLMLERVRGKERERERENMGVGVLFSVCDQAEFGIGGGEEKEEEEEEREQVWWSWKLLCELVSPGGRRRSGVGAEMDRDVCKRRCCVDVRRLGVHIGTR